jgi:2,5-diketo-D-gluconate reductase A
MTGIAAAPMRMLANGVAIPQVGLGTWPMNDAEAARAVAEALRLGYRLIDTAENYGNEKGVGEGIRASGVDRSAIFVTSKFNARWHSHDGVQQAFANSAARLGLDYLDLLLIHWPMPAQDRYVDAYRGMIRLLEDRKIRALGLSNFKPAHIDRLIAATGVTPHLNQIQLNPWVGRHAERAWHGARGIVTESWAPIGKGGDLLREEPIVRAAARHGKMPSQVVLRWHVQNGLVPIPKSASSERLALNLDVFGFELGPDEMAAISALDRGGVGAVDSDQRGH